MKNSNKTSAIRRYRRYFIIGLVFCIVAILGWYVVVRLISPWTVVTLMTLPHDASQTADIPVTALRVGCYNIAHGRGGRFEATNWEGGNRAEKIARMKQIADLLKAAQLDIVVLNEADFSSVWSGHINQARVIAEEAGYPYLVEQRNLDAAIPFVSVRFGNAILSKYPITDVTFLDYPNTSEFAELLIGGFKEGVIGTVTLPDGSRLQVAAIHLSVNSEPVRIASARMILEHQQQSGLPLLMMGDFNTAFKGYPQHHADETGQNTLELLLESQQVTTVLPGLPIPPEAFTFPSEKPARVIDWIFVSEPWHIQDTHVIQTPLSDHLPVTAVLTRVQNP